MTPTRKTRPRTDGPITIDRHVPVPLSAGRGLRKYPWDELRVGDSFLAPVRSITNLSNTRALAQAKTGFRFTLRTVPEGVRVWRIK